MRTAAIAGRSSPASAGRRVFPGAGSVCTVVAAVSIYASAVPSGWRWPRPGLVIAAWTAGKMSSCRWRPVTRRTLATSDREEILRPGPLSVTVSITDLRLDGLDRLPGVRRGRSLLLAPRAGPVALRLGAAEGSAHDPEQLRDA